MWRALRNTLSLGRSGVPLILRRMRNFRRSRPSSLFAMSSSVRSLLAGLTGLATNVLASIADALSGVRLGRPERAHRRGDLPQRALVRGVQDDDRALRVAGHLRAHTGGKRVDDRVRQAERKVQ